MEQNDKTLLTVAGMSCASCVHDIREALAATGLKIST